MMTPGAAERVIGRALDEGLITPDEVVRHSALGSSALRLIGLVHDGLLSPAVVGRLFEDTSSDDGVPGSTLTSSAPAKSNGDERFEMGDLVGQGGMGKVYRAYDTSLKRVVAIKLLKSEDPDCLSRFLREAQAQARVVHENVCKIFEVGELDGKPYIAMQLIEGQSLFVTDGEVSRPSPALHEMTVEHKVRLMQKVAEGIHAAHREGLIHRDIKPSNIMLERTETGEFKPYVLDFGLAREVASAGVTSLGLAAGTPSYMAPEQARGEAGALDRRTDVYGLGATLYALLAGKPPFEGPSSLDVLVKVTEEEPPSLREVPEDLAIIASKCLHKEPGQRYDSARALAEDLGRYLDGEPIHARKTSLWYRLLKKAKKHQRLVAAGALAAASFLVLGGWSVQTQLRARRQARLAGLFGQEVKAIESRIRMAHLLPRHDLTPEKTAIRRRMAALEEQMKAIGSAAEGPGEYALGRGHLALNEYGQARGHLDHAWKSGYREREVAYALGQVMGALYQQELQEAQRIGNAKQREEKKRELEREYRDPALRYLEQSRGIESESPDYVLALVAFYEDKPELALQKAAQAFAQSPLLYEAKTLEGDVYAAIVNEKLQGGHYEDAATAFDQASAAYRSAAEISRSDPGPYEGLVNVAELMIRLKMYSGGAQDMDPYFDMAFEACEHALQIAPDSVKAHSLKASVHTRNGERAMQQGQDPQPFLGPAMEAAQRAIELDPKDAAGYQRLGSANAQIATYRVRSGLDPRSHTKEAVRLLETAYALSPTSGSIANSLAVILSYRAEYDMSHGRDPEPDFEQAIRYFKAAIALRPTNDLAYSNLSRVLVQRATWQFQAGGDPRPALEQALQTALQCLGINPQSETPWASRSQAHNLRARFEHAQGNDVETALREAVDAEESGLRIHPRHGPLRLAEVETFGLQARLRLDQGQDPQQLIEGGRRAVARVLADNPGNAGTHLPLAQLGLLDAQWRLADGRSPAPAFDEAEKAVSAALRSNPDSVQALLRAAEVHWRRAAWQQSLGQAGMQEIVPGQRFVDRALAINSTSAEAAAIRAIFYLQEAAARPRQRDALLEAARHAWTQARTRNPHLVRDYGRMLAAAGT